MGAPSVLTYDDEDRLKTFMGQTYTYNGFDTRVAKNAGGSVTAYHRDGSGVTAPLISDSVATYTPGVSERRNGVSTFLNSGLKDVAKQTDISGNVTATRKYDAYGMVIGSTGTWKGPFGYSGSAGYQEDETGLQLLGHRYYDSSTGRFITRDPIKDGRNWYGYCGNNPVNSIDSDGLMVMAAAPALLIPGVGEVIGIGAIIIGGGYLLGKALIWVVYSYKPHSGGGEAKRNKHEEGQATRQRDQGGEKGDARRNLPKIKNPPTQPGKDSDDYLRKGPKGFMPGEYDLEKKLWL
jgi:RHS repeat-associated protein